MVLSGQKIGSEFLINHLLFYIIRPDMIQIMYSLKPAQILRFWKWVKKTPKGCWEWQGCLTKGGYGRFQVHPKTLRAHRVSYFLFNGPIIDSQLVLHKCDNPLCVNPEHLFLGTSKENTDDMIAKGRLSRHRSKHKNSISKYAGVSFRKDTGRWRARIMVNYSNILVGQFDTEEEAHHARLNALEKIDCCA